MQQKPAWKTRRIRLQCTDKVLTATHIYSHGPGLLVVAWKVLCHNALRSPLFRFGHGRLTANWRKRCIHQCDTPWQSWLGESLAHGAWRSRLYSQLHLCLSATTALSCAQQSRLVPCLSWVDFHDSLKPAWLPIHSYCAVQRLPLVLFFAMPDQNLHAIMTFTSGLVGSIQYAARPSSGCHCCSTVCASPGSICTRADMPRRPGLLASHSFTQGQDMRFVSSWMLDKDNE